MDVDGILRSLGKYGRYQVLQYAYHNLCFPSISYNVVIYVFIGYIPEFLCKVPTEHISKNYNPWGIQNVTIVQQKCDVIISTNQSGTVYEEKVSCRHGYEFFGPETTASEWNLVCGSESLGSMTTTVAVTGQMVGAGIFTALADKYGRRLICYTNYIAMVACYIIASVVPWFSAFVILRFLIGALSEGFGLTLATLSLEIFPAETRGFVIFLGSIGWSLAISSIALIAYLLRHVSWRYTMLASGLIGVHSLAMPWILQESPRWLIANGKYKEARGWIERAAKWNKRNVSNIVADLEISMASDDMQVIFTNGPRNPDVDDIPRATGLDSKDADAESEILVQNNTDSSQEKAKCKEQASQEERLSILDIFRHRHLFITSLIVWIVWFVNSLTYYGLFLTSGTISGNMYVNFFLNGIVEIPSVFLYMFTIDRYGRKFTCVMFHVIAGVCLCGSALLMYAADTSITNGLALALNFAGKFGITGSWTAIFLYTPEIYPTNLRAIGMGLASQSARIAGMISPYAGMFGSYVQWGPGVVFGSLSILVTILFLWLPETTGKELPNSLDEVTDFLVLKDKKKVVSTINTQ